MNYEGLAELLNTAEEAQGAGGCETSELLAQQALTALDALPAEAQEMPETAQFRVRALLLLALSARSCSEYANALTYAQSALGIARKNGLRGFLTAKAELSVGITYWYLDDYAAALDAYTASLDSHVEAGNAAGAAATLGNIGMVFTSVADYPRALEFHGKALAAHEKLGDMTAVARGLGNIGNVYWNLSDFPRALEYYDRALAAHEQAGDAVGVGRVTGNIGLVYEAMKDYSRALEYHARSLKIQVRLGDKAMAARVTGNIGNVYVALGEYDEAMKCYRTAMAAGEELGQKSAIALLTGNIGALYARREYDDYDAALAEQYLLKGIELGDELGIKRSVCELYRTLAGLYHAEGQWERYAVYFGKYYALEKEIHSEEVAKTAAQFEIKMKIAEREKRFAVERAEAEATKKLLHNTLPPEIAARLLAGEKIADFYANVSVLFADIADFTRLSQAISPKELVDGLDFLFSKFDELAGKHGLEKIKTIGDCYMAIAGAPTDCAYHAEAVARMALDMLDAAAGFRAIATGEPIRLRIGLHTGEVVAGVIGTKKYTYDLWGDAVNTASRMESHGEAGRIHVSEEFMRAVGAVHELPLRFIPRGELDIKGKGMMRTYFLEKEQ